MLLPPYRAVWLYSLLWIPITIGLSKLIVLLISIALFWPITRGQIPIPTNYMLSWYEPWKSEFTSNGVPFIPHKPVIDDAFRHLYPLRVLASEIIKNGQWPLWNPYNASGTPLLAIWHPGYLTPFGMFFLFLPSHIAWSIYILLQPIVLGLATYWYTRKVKFSPVASMLAVFTLVLSGFSVTRLEYGEFLYVLAGLPLLLGIVEDTHYRIWIPIIIATMILSGQPHMIVYTLSVFALYTLIRLPWRKTLVYAGFSLLGVAMISIQILPSIELFSLSTISRQTSEFIFDKFLLPISHLITIVIPNYFGNQATYNYFGPHDYVETIAYVGVIPVLFALFSLRRFRQDSVIRFFAILAVLTILTTLQWVGAKLFFLLPLPVLSADVPSRVFVLTTFAISILAGFGVTDWEKHPSYIRRWILGFGVLLGGIVLATVYLYRFHAPCPTTIPQCRMVSLRTTGLELTGFALFVLSALLVARIKMLRWIPMGVVLVLGLYNAQKFLPFSPRETIFPDPPMISQLQQAAGIDRYTNVGTTFRSNLMAIYKLQSTQYFDPLNVKRYAELVSFVNTGDRFRGLTRSDIQVVSDASVSAEIAFRRERFWDMTGTSVLVTKKDDHWQIQRRTSALPRAYLVTRLKIEHNPDALLARLFLPEIDITNTAFVENSVLLVPDDPTARGRAEITSYTPNRISISTESPEDTFLVLSDTYYPGWKAYVDGNETFVYRTNYAFRGVVVPEGAHTVVFRYKPTSFAMGLWISGISVVVWIVLVFWYNRKTFGSVAKW